MREVIKCWTFFFFFLKSNKKFHMYLSRWIEEEAVQQKEEVLTRMRR